MASRMTSVWRTGGREDGTWAKSAEASAALRVSIARASGESEAETEAEAGEADGGE